MTDTPPRSQLHLKRWRVNAERAEPWRDWAILTAVNHALLVVVVLVRPSAPWLLVFALPLGLSLATTVLTVLHDAGHRRFSRRAWAERVGGSDRGADWALGGALVAEAPGASPRHAGVPAG